MSMRPTPFGLCDRAPTLRPTPAGTLSPCVGETIFTVGPDTMLMVRVTVSATPATFVAVTTMIRLSSAVSAGLIG